LRILGAKRVKFEIADLACKNKKNKKILKNKIIKIPVEEF